MYPDHTKVFLPGESLWVKNVEKTEDKLIGVIDNHPICHHVFKFGDVVSFQLIDYGDGITCWEPTPQRNTAEIERCIPRKIKKSLRKTKRTVRRS